MVYNAESNESRESKSQTCVHVSLQNMSQNIFYYNTFSYKILVFTSNMILVTYKPWASRGRSVLCLCSS